MNLPCVDRKATGLRIYELMDSKGMTVKDIQNIFGFSTPQAIYKWLNGLCSPTIDNLVILASIFGVTIDEIVVIRRV